jgi:hypothetical protein
MTKTTIRRVLLAGFSVMCFAVPGAALGGVSQTGAPGDWFVWNRYNWAPPAYHACPFGGDWCVDIYGGAGAAVRYYDYYHWGEAGMNTVDLIADGCSPCGCSEAGGYVKIEIYDHYVQRFLGWIVYAHLDNRRVARVNNMPNHTVLGYVAGIPSNSNNGCYNVVTSEGTHTHFEQFNYDSQWACWYPHAPTTTLFYGNMLGWVGDTGRYAKGSCW